MKIFIEDEFKKINYVDRHSAARLGRGFQTNAGQVGLGSSRPESTRPGHVGLVLYSMLFSISMPVPFWLVCVLLKNVNKSLMDY